MSDRANVRILVGQLVDEANNNAQCLNIKALLSRTASTQICWTAPYYHRPAPLVERSWNVCLVRLWRRRFWTWHKFFFYQRSADAIFYPGVYWFDDLALQVRKRIGRRIPVIATLEGFAGNEQREHQLSQWAGHPVFCQPVAAKLLARIDRVLNEADHVIAISPFIARMGSYLYGSKFSVLSLGVDLRTFFPPAIRTGTKFTVVGVGTVYARKRPQVFLDLAQRFPMAAFLWLGEGELRKQLMDQAKQRGLLNLEFRGAIANDELADEFRRADLFVLPSRSEGVPKVIQEAAACGLPAIVFGYYETPTVIEGQNGYVVWSDEQLFERVGELIEDRAVAVRMGLRGAKLAKEWNWDQLAPQWEDTILQVALKNRK